MKLKLTVEVLPPDGLAISKIKETTVALHELGIEENIVTLKR